MDEFKIVFPFNGDVLGNNDVSILNEQFFTKISIQGNATHLLINGNKLEINSPVSDINIPIKKGLNILQVFSKNTAKTVSFFLNPNVDKGFRYTIDDVILCLKDLTENEYSYSSLFENPFFSLLKKSHDLSGTKFVLHLFYDTSTVEGFNKEISYFSLSLMTSKFKKEFIENSSWLKFGFHSKSENPPSPYSNGEIDEIQRDLNQVHKEIIRFAGEECLASETTIHYADLKRDTTKTVIQNGYKVLNGFFFLNNQGNPLVSYHYSKELVNHLSKRDFYFDFDLNCYLSRLDLVLNYYQKTTEAVGLIKQLIEEKHQNGFIDLITHEQYFYPDYSQYIPQYGEIVIETAKLLKSKDYESIFVSEIFKQI